MGGRSNNEKFSARKRAMNYKASRKLPTTNPRMMLKTFSSHRRRNQGGWGATPPQISKYMLSAPPDFKTRN